LRRRQGSEPASETASIHDEAPAFARDGEREAS